MSPLLKFPVVVSLGAAAVFSQAPSATATLDRHEIEIQVQRRCVAGAAFFDNTTRRVLAPGERTLAVDASMFSCEWGSFAGQFRFDLLEAQQVTGTLYTAVNPDPAGRCPVQTGCLALTTPPTATFSVSLGGTGTIVNPAGVPGASLTMTINLQPGIHLAEPLRPASCVAVVNVGTFRQPATQAVQNRSDCPMSHLGIDSLTPGPSGPSGFTVFSRVDGQVAMTGASFNRAVPNSVGVIVRFNVRSYWRATIAPPVRPDLSISNIEVTQAIQTADNSVPLVPYKLTAVRVYVKRDGPQPIDGVSARLRGFRRSGEADGSPLSPYNGPITPSPNPDREKHENSLNFILPESWVWEGDLELEAQIVPPGGLTESRTDNNVLRTKKFTIAYPPKFVPPFLVVYFPVCGVKTNGIVTCAPELPGNPTEFMDPQFPVASRHLLFFPLSTPLLVKEEGGFVERIAPILSYASAFDDLASGGLLVPANYFVAGARTDLLSAITLDALAVENEGNIAAAVAGRYFSVANGLDAARNCAAPVPGVSVVQGIGETGFDPPTKRVVLSTTREFSFVRGFCAVWMSVSEYMAIHSKIGDLGRIPLPPAVESAARRRAEDPPEFVIVGGSIAKDGSSAELQPAFRVSPRKYWPESDPQGDHCVKFLGSDGVLGDHCFAAVFGKEDFFVFSFRLPLPPGTTRIALRRGETELASLAPTPARPEVRILSVTSGEQWTGGIERSLSWEASDADGDTLSFIAQYSFDGGQRWMPLTAPTARTETPFSTSHLFGGKDVWFRVLASDGFHTTAASVGPIEIVQTPKIEASNVDFRLALVRGFSDRSLEIGNTGTGPLTISTIAAEPAGFEVLGPSAPLVVPAGGKRAVNLRFAPTSAGTAAGRLTLASDDPSVASLTVDLRGTGVATAIPDMDVATAPLEFGEVKVGESKDIALKVKNWGPGELTIQSAASSNARYTISGATFPFRLAAGAEQSLTVRFRPTAAAAENGNLVVSGNDPNRASVSVPLRGQGVN